MPRIRIHLFAVKGWGSVSTYLPRMGRLRHFSIWMYIFLFSSLTVDGRARAAESLVGGRLCGYTIW